MIISDSIEKIREVLKCVRIYKIFEQEFDKEEITSMPAAFIDVGDVDLEQSLGIIKKDRTNPNESIYYEKNDNTELEIIVSIVDKDRKKVEGYVVDFLNNFPLVFQDTEGFPIKALRDTIENNEDESILEERWTMDINMRFQGVLAWQHKIKTLPPEVPTITLTPPP